MYSITTALADALRAALAAQRYREAVYTDRSTDAMHAAFERLAEAYRTEPPRLTSCPYCEPEDGEHAEQCPSRIME